MRKTRLLICSLLLPATAALAAVPPAAESPARPSTAMPGTPTRATNSAVNARDRSGSTLTPEDQSQLSSDVERLAALRRAVMDVPGLSSDGQNIKIISTPRRVTLRGPVQSVAEREAIEARVRAIAGSAEVDSQLEAP